MARHVVLALLVGCADAGPLAADQSAIALPRGAGTDLAVTLDGQPLAPSELAWSTDAKFVTLAATSDGSALRVTGAFEGDTTIHLTARDQTLSLPAHVAPPAIVQLWIEPGAVSAAIGTTVAIRATAIDTTSEIRDVSNLTTWVLEDPTVAVVDHDGIRAAASGTTTLAATVAGVTGTATVTVY